MTAAKIAALSQRLEALSAEAQQAPDARELSGWLARFAGLSSELLAYAEQIPELLAKLEGARAYEATDWHPEP